MVFVVTKRRLAKVGKGVTDGYYDAPGIIRVRVRVPRLDSLVLRVPFIGSCGIIQAWMGAMRENTANTSKLGARCVQVLVVHRYSPTGRTSGGSNPRYRACTYLAVGLVSKTNVTKSATYYAIALLRLAIFCQSGDDLCKTPRMTLETKVLLSAICTTKIFTSVYDNSTDGKKIVPRR